MWIDSIHYSPWGMGISSLEAGKAGRKKKKVLSSTCVTASMICLSYKDNLMTRNDPSVAWQDLPQEASSILIPAVS